MALPHATPATAIDVRPLGERLPQTASQALLKTASLELMRLVLRAGESLPPHGVDSEATLQCIEGAVRVSTSAGDIELPAGRLTLLPAGCVYAVRASVDASLLVTMLLPYAGSASATSPG